MDVDRPPGLVFTAQVATPGDDPGTQDPSAPESRAIAKSRGRPKASIVPVKPSTVTFGLDALEVEGERLQSITRSIGVRLRHWLTKTEKSELPDARWTDIYRYYQASVLGQLREQRERAKQAGADTMSTEALEAQFRVEVLLAIRSFSEADWEIADRARSERFGPGRWVPATEVP